MSRKSPLISTTLPTFPRPVFVTEGGMIENGRIYGVFATPRDARSENADRLAIATIGRDQLTAEQAAQAKTNSERL